MCQPLVLDRRGAVPPRPSSTRATAGQQRSSSSSPAKPPSRPLEPFDLIASARWFRGAYAVSRCAQLTRQTWSACSPTRVVQLIPRAGDNTEQEPRSRPGRLLRDVFGDGLKRSPQWSCGGSRPPSRPRSPDCSSQRSVARRAQRGAKTLMRRSSLASVVAHANLSATLSRRSRPVISSSHTTWYGSPKGRPDLGVELAIDEVFTVGQRSPATVS
jgi:hypothetical protein